ncbi:MAG: hypothetical protein ABUK20_03810 [Anaerolineales bacterium]
MKKDNIEVVSKALRIYFLAGALIAAIGLFVLLWIPTDPKNVWLIGYSKNRLALSIVFIFFVLMFAYLANKSYRNPRFNQVLVKKAIDVVTEYRSILLVMLPLYGFTFILLFVYFYSQIRYQAITSLQVVLDRLLPLVFFGLSLFIMTYLVIILISTRFPISQLGNRTQYINPKKIFIFLLSVMGLLILLSVTLNLLSLLDIPVFRVTRRIFDLNTERNIPTLFSSVTLLVSAVLLGYIAYLTRITGGPYSILWAVLSLGFLFLSVDETAYIHENLSEDVGGWIFVVAPFVILFFIVYTRFFLHLPRKTKLLFLCAGFLFIGGAFILEFIGSWQISLADENNLATTMVFTTIEESFEMFGINLFIFSLLLYLRDNFPAFYLSFQNPDQ